MYENWGATGKSGIIDIRLDVDVEPKPSIAIMRNEYSLHTNYDKDYVLGKGAQNDTDE